MSHLKTALNPKKAGRPRLAPTVTVSLRIPKETKERIVAKYGKTWIIIFRDFVRVYLDS